MVPPSATPRPTTERRIHFPMTCARCGATMRVDAAAVSHSILISIDPCETCRYDPPLAEWDGVRAEARRLLRGGVDA